MANDKGEQPRTQFTGFADLGAHVADNLTEHINAGIGRDFQWPGWNEAALGKPPVIDMPAFQNAGDVSQFSQVLSNLSKMADIESASALRDQLKKLSGKEINIIDLKGNQDENYAPIGTPLTGPKRNYPGNPPRLTFNPNVWGKYPVENSKIAK